MKIMKNKKRKRNESKLKKSNVKEKKKIKLSLDHFCVDTEYIKRIKIIGDFSYPYVILNIQTNKGNEYHCNLREFSKEGIGLPLLKKEGLIKKVLYTTYDIVTLILLTSNGVIYTQGNNEMGQCGISCETIYVDTLTKVSIDEKIDDIQMSEDHAIALSFIGGVYCWGYSGFGQCGNGTKNIVRSPMKINRFFDVPLNEDEIIVKIRCSQYISLGLTNRGNVYHWGLIRYQDGYSFGVPSRINQMQQILKSNEHIIDIHLLKTLSFAMTNLKSVIEWTNMYFERAKDPMHFYSKSGNENLIQFFIHHSLDVNLKDDKGLIPLNHACLNNSPQIIQLLLESHSEVTIKDENSFFPIQRILNHDGIYYNDYHCVDLILQREPSLVHSVIHGQSLLHLFLKSLIMD